MVTPEKGLRLPHASTFRKPIEMLQSFSKLLGEAKGGLPAYLPWASEVLLVA
jgi:hypothetical protein